MRPEPNVQLDQYRLALADILRDGTLRSPPGSNYGLFRKGPLRMISSGGAQDNPYGLGWEHVSVSCEERCPTWEELCEVKDLFWDDAETVVQFHPAKKYYVNHHPFCLHLWKKAGQEYELPPKPLI